VIPAVNQNRLLVHVHGGGYVYNPGEAGTGEATLMAAYGGFRVISFDYRMPPDHPYPAAMDDAMAVWKRRATGTQRCDTLRYRTLRPTATALRTFRRASPEPNRPGSIPRHRS
jgi:monoterpene epsilon-lactone hydrolase